jgi:hypothetical protein
METFAMSTPHTSFNPAPLALDGWDRTPQRIQPLPGQAGLFEYRPHAAADGQVELFDSGRDLPGAVERDQRILWDVEQ